MKACKLLSFGLIKITGIDAEKFLQGQLTCDVATIRSQQAVLAAHCSYQGRIISNFLIYKQEKDFYLVLPKTVIPIAKAHLLKYAVFSKVAIEELNDPIFGAWTESEHTIALPSSFKNRYILINTTEKFDFIDEKIWLLENIKAGVAYVVPETSNQFTPHMIGLVNHGGVSFNKGCYLGQEIVARTEHLGKAKRHLYWGQIQSTISPQPGNPVDHMGTILTAAHSTENTIDCLMVLEDRALTEPTITWQQQTISGIISPFL